VRTEVVKVRLSTRELADVDEALEVRETRSELVRAGIKRELEARAQVESETSPAGPLEKLEEMLASLRPSA
jgi:metal-responsive CopG/Arc/MetJ family transcriptional regulator